MKDSNFLCKENIVNHFRYRWYLYVLALIAAIAIPTIIFSVSGYDSPEDKRIDFFMVKTNNYESLVKPVFNKLVDESGVEVESVTYEFVNDDSMGTVSQIMVLRMISKEKDILILDSEDFQGYASQGMFLPLEDRIPSDCLQYLEKKDKSGHSRETGDNGYIGADHLYGIPLSALPGMTAEPLFFNDLYLAVFYDCGNEENVIKVVNKIIEYGMKEPVTEVPSSESADPVSNDPV